MQNTKDKERKRGNEGRTKGMKGGRKRQQRRKQGMKISKLQTSFVIFCIRSSLSPQNSSIAVIV